MPKKRITKRSRRPPQSDESRFSKIGAAIARAQRARALSDAHPKGEPMDNGLRLVVETLKGIIEKSSAAGVLLVLVDDTGGIVGNLHVRQDLQGKARGVFAMARIAQGANGALSTAMGTVAASLDVAPAPTNFAQGH